MTRLRKVIPVVIDIVPSIKDTGSRQAEHGISRSVGSVECCLYCDRSRDTSTVRNLLRILKWSMSVQIREADRLKSCTSRTYALGSSKVEEIRIAGVYFLILKGQLISRSKDLAKCRSQHSTCLRHVDALSRNLLTVSLTLSRTDEDSLPVADSEYFAIAPAPSTLGKTAAQVGSRTSPSNVSIYSSSVRANRPLILSVSSKCV